MLEIDKVVVGIGVDGRRVGRGRVASRRIGRRDRLRLDRRRAAEGRIVENRKILRDRPIGRRIKVLDLGHAAPAMGVSHDDACIDCEGFAPDDPFLDAARHHGLEQLAQEIALAETAMAVLGKRRMIGNVAIEPQATEPSVGQIEMDLLAQPTLRANAEAMWRCGASRRLARAFAQRLRDMPITVTQDIFRQ